VSLDNDADGSKSGGSKEVCAHKPSTAKRSDRSRGRSRRPGVWLTTVSTVVAVATGMFTLRDQIFHEETGVTHASADAYGQLVGHVCDQLNEADRARRGNAKRLARRLRRGRSTLAYRNALLDSTKEILAWSERSLAGFSALDVPISLVTTEHATAAAWRRMVTRWRGYAQGLDQATNRDGLDATIKTLPAMRTAFASDGVKRTEGLIKLGGGRCKLDPPIVIPTITLPNTMTSVSPPSSPDTAPAPASSRGNAARPGTTAADDTNPVEPSSVSPDVAPGSESKSTCSDGRDNDLDGETDFPKDPGCSALSGGDEKEAACSDGRDNDADGQTDFPKDPGCSALSDGDEKETA